MKLQTNSVTVLNPIGFSVGELQGEKGVYLPCPILRMGAHASIIFTDWRQLEELRDVVNTALNDFYMAEAAK